MRTQTQATTWQAAALTLLRFLTRNLPAVTFLILAFAGMLATYWFFRPVQNSAIAFAAGASDGVLSAAITKPLPAKPVEQRLTQSPGPIRVGIISGHKANDPGAVCDDGLTEAEVNLNISQMVVNNLQAQGITVDLLDEFDPRLDGYVATALISIHADSCVYYNDLATGFKIAGSAFTDSSALFNCMEQAYDAVTQMPYHANTITPHMTDYHAFRKIAPGTPAIIIETGFMNLDRVMLTTNARLPAEGIIQGISCYLDQQ